MKYLALLIAIFFCTSVTYASTSLRVQDPHQTWKTHRGNIDSAAISIEAKGAYFECGLYLTFSSAPYNTSLYSSDTFEVQMPFDLPVGAFITDTWLWVDNQIVRAALIERNRANLVYEGTVQRRQDPSILYKNSATQYELRVYPMPAMRQRKVKITYMVPAKWVADRAICPLPLNILRTSATVPALEVLSYTDNNWNSPQIEEIAGAVFQTVSGQLYKSTLISMSSVLGSNTLSYSLNSPMQNGIYAAVYPTDLNNGYYQFVMVPRPAMNIVATKKILFLFDSEFNGIVTGNEVLLKTKRLLLDNFLPTDSFNLFFYRLGVYQYRNNWIPCNPDSIDQIFNQLLYNNPITSVSHLPSLLSIGIDFIKGNNNGEIMLLTSANNYSQVSQANQLITDVLAQMGHPLIPIHIADYQSGNFNNSGYLYSNLAALTGGNYESSREIDYTIGTMRGFSATVDDLVSQLQIRITNFDCDMELQTGFAYASYDNAENRIVYANRPYIRTGRYTGTLPINITVSGLCNDVPISQTFTLNNALIADSFTRKIWVAKYLSELEAIGNINNATKAEIIDSSMNSRVLSIYTAFLALEPGDTIPVCGNCVGETDVVSTTIKQDLVTAGIRAYPNPFNGSITIRVSLMDDNASLKIYNTLGQLVKTFGINHQSGDDVIINWKGDANSGSQLSAGVYLMVLETKEGKQSFRIVKE